MSSLTNSGKGFPYYLPLQVNVESFGKMNSDTKTGFAGTRGKSKRLEAIHIDSDSLKSVVPGVEVWMKVYKSGSGWDGDNCTNSEWHGSFDQGIAIEAFQAELRGPQSSMYKLKYSAHVDVMGDLPSVSAPEVMGTTGQNRVMEGLTMWLEPADREFWFTDVVISGENSPEVMPEPIDLEAFSQANSTKSDIIFTCKLERSHTLGTEKKIVWNEENKETTSKAKSFSATVSFKVKGVGVSPSASQTTTVTSEVTFSKGGEETESQSTTISAGTESQIHCKPGKKTSINAQVLTYTVQLPVTGTFHQLLAGGERVTKLTGWYHGVHANQIQFVTTEQPL